MLNLIAEKMLCCSSLVHASGLAALVFQVKEAITKKMIARSFKRLEFRGIRDCRVYLVITLRFLSRLHKIKTYLP